MHFISVNNLAALVGTSNATVQKWAENSTYPTHTHNGVKGFYMEELDTIPEVVEMLNENWDEEQVVNLSETIPPLSYLQAVEVLLLVCLWLVLSMSY